MDLQNNSAEKIAVLLAERKAVVNLCKMIINLPGYLDQLEFRVKQNQAITEKIKKNTEGGTV